MNAEKVKCVIWDLDNTIWKGILAESDQVTLKDNIKTILENLITEASFNLSAVKMIMI